MNLLVNSWVSRRSFLRVSLMSGAALASGLLSACASTPVDATPTLKITYPLQGAIVPANDQRVIVETRNWNLVKANQDVRPKEGHIHFFIDVPASSVELGKVIPTDKPESYVHVGAPPLTSRVLKLKPGVHTVTVVMGDSQHQALAEPAPVSVTFVVA